jgi:hypothetical protein
MTDEDAKQAITTKLQNVDVKEILMMNGIYSVGIGAT